MLPIVERLSAAEGSTCGVRLVSCERLLVRCRNAHPGAMNSRLPLAAPKFPDALLLTWGETAGRRCLASTRPCSPFHRRPFVLHHACRAPEVPSRGLNDLQTPPHGGSDTQETPKVMGGRSMCPSSSVWLRRFDTIGGASFRSAKPPATICEIPGSESRASSTEHLSRASVDCSDRCGGKRLLRHVAKSAAPHSAHPSA
jgi:hypothetical protein